MKYFPFAFLLLLGACTDIETNMALGTLERDRITLAATAAELITQQPVAEGAVVSKGTLLVQLDTTLQDLTIRKVEADIAQLSSRLDQLRNGVRPEEIAAAQARVESAQALQKENEHDLTRIRDLVSRRLAAQADLDTAETRLESNSARVRDAQAQLQLLRSGTRIEEVTQAEAQLLASQALLATEQQKLANLAIVATRDGTLDSLPFHVGERVAVGAQVAIILAEGAPYARVYIPETSRAALAVGSILLVHVDGVAQAFTGSVRWIALEPAFTPYYALNSAERSRLVYLAEVQLPESANVLPSGLPAQVELP